MTTTNKVNIKKKLSKSCIQTQTIRFGKQSACQFMNWLRTMANGTESHQRHAIRLETQEKLYFLCSTFNHGFGNRTKRGKIKCKKVPNEKDKRKTEKP